MVDLPVEVGISEQMKEYIDEIILGDDKNLEKLKEQTIDFFRNKNQPQLDLVDKNQLNQIAFLNRFLTTIESGEELTDVQRALLDNAFHEKKPLKYYWSFKKSKITSRIIEMGIYLAEVINFKDKKDFIEYLGWVVENKDVWDNAEFTNVQEDFMIQLGITNYNSNESSDVNIFMIGNKKYETLMEGALAKL